MSIKQRCDINIKIKEPEGDVSHCWDRYIISISKKKKKKFPKDSPIEYYRKILPSQKKGM